MKDIIYKDKDVLGLDIGTELIKYVQLKNKGKLTKLIGYGKIEIPDNILVEGIISEPEKLAKIIKENLNNPPWGKITAEKVISSLPESKLFTRTIELPPISDKEIEEAINFEIDQSIPASSSDLYIDWQIVSENEKNINVLFAAAPRAIVDSYIHLFNLIDLEPISLEISLSAISEALISERNKSKPLMIIDIGGNTTNMAAYDKKITITGSHPVGHKTILESLKSVLSIDNKKAEALLKKGIVANKTDKGSEIIKNEFKKVITEIDRMVKYHEEKNDKSKISEILLCGGLGSMSGLCEFIENETKIKTSVGNPWSNISVYPLKPVPKNEASMYAASIGLCIRGMKNE